MASTQVALGYPANAKMFQETAIGATVLGVDAAAGTLYMIDVDNAANASVEYLKLWDAGTGAVTLGTTAPDWIIRVPASTRVQTLFVASNTFSTALSVACVTTAGTAGVTPPGSSVICRIVYA